MGSVVGVLSCHPCSRGSRSGELEVLFNHLLAPSCPTDRMTGTWKVMRLTQIMVRNLEPELEASLLGIFNLHLYQYLLSSGLFALRNVIHGLESRSDRVESRFPQISYSLHL